MSKLFRQEALDHQRRRLVGEVILLQPVSFGVMGVALLLAVLAVGVYVFNGTYARKETVPGFVTPRGGIVTVRGVPGTTVTDVHVREGDRLARGDPIVTLSRGPAMADGARVGALLAEQIDRQVEAAGERLRAGLDRLDLADRDDRLQLEALARERAGTEEAAALLSERVALAEENLALRERLVERGVLARAALEAERADVLALRQSRLEYDGRIREIDARVAAIKARGARRSSDRDELRASVDAELSRLQSSRVETGLRDETVLRAQGDVVVTALFAVEGRTVDGQRPLAALRPADGELVIELLVPTRAAAFLNTDQDVRIMYEAFPFQRYGVQAGRLESITSSVLLPGDTASPVPLNEPAYRAVVRPELQGIEAFGQTIPLRPGMVLRADVVLDQRSFLDVILEPLRTLRR